MEKLTFLSIFLLSFFLLYSLGYNQLLRVPLDILSGVVDWLSGVLRSLRVTTKPSTTEGIQGKVIPSSGSIGR